MSRWPSTTTGSAGSARSTSSAGTCSRAIEKDFAASGIDLPVYWGNRNWASLPGRHRRARWPPTGSARLAFVTSAYSSFSSCRQYLDDIERPGRQVGRRRPAGRQDPASTSTTPASSSRSPPAAAAAVAVAAGRRSGLMFDLVFTAHSIPAAMAAASGPGGRRVPGAAGRGGPAGRRAGRRHQALAAGLPEPQRPAVAALAGPGYQRVPRRAGRGRVARRWSSSPVGFVCDHMEVRFDLDVEAAETARRLGLPLARAATPGTDPRFVSMITELVARAARRQRRARGALGQPGPAARHLPGRMLPPAAARPGERPASPPARPAGPPGGGRDEPCPRRPNCSSWPARSRQRRPGCCTDRPAGGPRAWRPSRARPTW